MATTNNLGITLVDQSQAQKEITINQAFGVLDAFVGRLVADKDLATPPSSPATSVMYIVAASSTGAWAGKATYLAYFDQVWRFIAPQPGMRVWVQDESLDYRFNGTAWVISGSGGGSWGSITGALSSQTDLQTALNAKAAITGQVFTGAVSATNLSGTNTGDQTITLSGEVTGSGTGSFATTLSNAAVTGKTLTGYSSAAGTLAASDTILQAIQKLNGNDALRAPLASPTFTGTVTLPAGQAVNGVTLTTTGGTTNFLRGDGTYAPPTSGGITAPGTTTSTAVALWNSTTGTALANSAVLIDASGNVTGAGTLASAAHTVTSASSSALAAGASGATNPVFAVDASTTSVVGGISVKGGATGGTTTITATDSGANHSLTISSKGFSGLNLNSPGFVNLQSSTVVINSTGLIMAQYSYRSYSASTAYTFNGIADTNLTASTEVLSFDLNFAQVKTHATGALTLQRDIRFRPSTHAFAAASTLTDAAGLAVDGAPIAGTNASVTNSSTIYSAGNAVGSGTTNSYAIRLTANTGATNNYISSYNGSGGEVLRLRSDGQITVLNTVTAAGTNGAQTINKPSGTVNFAASATSLVVTNSLCTANSIVFAMIRTNDSTADIKNVVPAAGSFTITLNAAATAATSVGFLIIN